MKHRFRAARPNRGGHSRTRDMDSHSVICDRTGFRAQASECVMDWDGAFVIAKYSEPRNAQESIRIPREKIAVSTARPLDTSKEIDQSIAPDWDIP